MHTFLNSPELKQLLGRAQEIKASGKRFSDIEDNNGQQYVDLVQEGGGVLGIALAGYTYILESVDIRFFSLAGTSAGAINMLMMAALGKIEEPKSEKILDMLSNKDLFDIVDGDRSIKKLVQKAIKKKKGLGWSLAVNAIKIYKTLKNRLGANPGNDFEHWITSELGKQDIHTVKDLLQLRKQVPAGLKYVVTGELIEGLLPDMAIITSDITTNTKVEFPRMAPLYWKDFESVSPAKLVRASMSIPFFFEPFKITGIPDSGKEEHPLWDKYAKYFGPVPAEVSFVDGGMLSNFPINVFHREDGGVPRMPTFGIRLSAYREKFNTIDSMLGFSGAMIKTMRQIHDYDFLIRNPDYRKLICRINADEEFNWLDFQMPGEEQVKLFLKGAAAAVNFLERFDWEKYKEIRQNLVMAQ